jgi:hypothetical protein
VLKTQIAKKYDKQPQNLKNEKEKTHWDFFIDFMNASLIGKLPPVEFYNLFQNFGDIFLWI